MMAAGWLMKMKERHSPTIPIRYKKTMVYRDRRGSGGLGGWAKLGVVDAVARLLRALLDARAHSVFMSLCASFLFKHSRHAFARRRLCICDVPANWSSKNMDLGPPSTPSSTTITIACRGAPTTVAPRPPTALATAASAQ